MPKLLIKDNMSLAPQIPSSNLALKPNHNFIRDSVTRVRLKRNNSALAT